MDSSMEPCRAQQPSVIMAALAELLGPMMRCDFRELRRNHRQISTSPAPCLSSRSVARSKTPLGNDMRFEFQAPSPAHKRQPRQRDDSPRLPRPELVNVMTTDDLLKQNCNVAIIAPGAGTHANGAVYASLGRSNSFSVEVVGQSRAPYDRYPESWPQGAPAPNLASFAMEVAARPPRADCLLVGSRGGQVVLPKLWQVMGPDVPPAVVINGGCAMKLPDAVAWPETAVTFLLLGGRDHFRCNESPDQYLKNTRKRVPAANRTTAILYVEEMMHMPQAQLLSAILRPMLRACLAWQADKQHAPLRELNALLTELKVSGDWSGRLVFTSAKGSWAEVAFGSARGTLLGQRTRPRPLEAKGIAAFKGGA